MSLSLQHDLCIIGNGAIGKVAALSLSQAGFKVALVGPPNETDATPDWDVRVYALNHTAHSLLTSLKVWDAMDTSRIAPVDAMHIQGDATRPGTLNFDAYSARVDTLTWIVEEKNLNAALNTALKFSPNVHMFYGQARQLHINPNQATVSLDDGTIIDTPLVIGADGAHSWVRGQCDINLDFRSYQQRAIVTNFECTQPHHGIAYQWFTSSEGIIALLPLPEKRVSLVWSAPVHLAEQLLNMPLATLAQRVSERCQEQLGTLTPIQPEAIKSFPLSLIRPHHITASRVALIGDAAHVVHPLAGHGMNLGFGDLEVLIPLLTQARDKKDNDYERLLRRYARSRKENIFLMQATTDTLARIFAIDFEPLKIVRNLGMTFLNQLPFLKRRLIAQALGKPYSGQ